MLGRTKTRLLAGDFHPELRTLSRVLPGRAVSGPRTLRFLRRLEKLKRLDGSLEVHSCGPCEVVVYRPSGPTRGLILWLHGGGLILGSAKDDSTTCRRWANNLNAIVVSVEYRRPPEHPYPVAIEDCYAALLWAVSREELAGLPVVVAGGSAGAGLAAALTLLARDRKQVDVAAQILIYPMLDDRTVMDADPGHATRRLWDNQANRLGWTSYLGERVATDDVSPYAAAARAEDLQGLPPTWIGVGTLDLFYNENVQFTERLQDAGVDCEIIIVKGAFHGFDVFGKTSVAQNFSASYMAAMDRALS